jgi:hypothetical protein
MDKTFAIENARELERLKSVATRLTDAQLRQSIDDRWTIAVVLAHLAFWDQRSLCLMRKWKSSGVAPSPIDVDVTNDSLLPLWQALPPRAAANLAVSSAEEIDLELEAAPADLISAIKKLGERYRLYRSEHRKLHLDEIAEVLRRLDSTDPA